MKAIINFSYKFIFIFLLIGCETPEKRQSCYSINEIYYKQYTNAYTTEKQGLYLREKPNTSSKILNLLSKGSKVKILAGSQNDTIHNICSRWYKVEYKGKQGYIFGGFIEFEDYRKKKTIVSKGDKNTYQPIAVENSKKTPVINDICSTCIIKKNKR